MIKRLNKGVCRALASVCIVPLMLVSSQVSAVSSVKLADVPELAPSANQELVEFHQKIYEPANLKKIGKRVHMALGHSYANFSFIEGDEGIVLIDTGFFTGNAEEALKEFRKEVSQKPIVGIIYTHVHGDHRGGSNVFLKDAGKEIPVWAPEHWRDDEGYMASSLREMVVLKAFSQFGVLLPEGESGKVGSGIGPITRMKGAMGFVEPNKVANKVTELTIGGVKVVLIPMYGDIKGHMWIWLPDDKVMFTGDTIMGTTMPYISTARFEPDRKALEFVKSLDRLMDYPVEHVVPGHGRPLIGQKDVVEVSTLNRDFAQLLANQVTRFILKGYSADEAIDRFVLPPAMANHPDMQPYYHRLPWIIRGLYVKRSGWVDSIFRLTRHSDSEQAKRLVSAMGGIDSVNAESLKALNEKDYRWSAQLSHIALQVDSQNPVAVKLQIQSFQGLANVTRSANERNYLLTRIKEIQGKAPWAAVLAKVGLPTRLAQTDRQLLVLLQDRFKAEDALELQLRIAIVIEGKRYNVRIRNGVLIIDDSIGGSVDAEFKVSHENFARLIVGAIDWKDALDKKILKTVSGPRVVKKFVNLIDPVFK